MKELIIDGNIIIDDAEAVATGIELLSGKQISSADVFAKFATTEKATKFYLDSKCQCRMQPDRDTVYLWLDSGFTDTSGRPIMISFLNNGGVFRGHYFGTFQTLANAIRDYYPRNAKEISRNLEGFRNKYNSKIAERRIKHIEDEKEFLVGVCNMETGFNTMGSLLSGLKIDFAEPEPEVSEVPEKETEPEEPEGFDMSFLEKEITIGLLLDKIDEMQNYIEELLAEIEKFKSEDKVRIAELEAKSEEYKAAMVRMRTFIAEENVHETEEAMEGFAGHALLGRSGKILVLGATALDHKVMYGIAKLFGFEKSDFDFETDYAKIVSFAGRLNAGANGYAALILGAMPHKVANLGDWSSLVEKCRQSDSLPDAYDARSRSGELKVTKESFKKALMDICLDLKKKRGK